MIAIMIPTRKRLNLARAAIQRLMPLLLGENKRTYQLYMSMSADDPSRELFHDFPGYIQLVLITKPGIGFARQQLLQRADKDGCAIGVFLDDDVRTRPEYLPRVVRALERTRSYVWLAGWRSLYERNGPVTKPLLSTMSMCYAVKIRPLLDVGGFDARLCVGEDNEIKYRLMLGFGQRFFRHARWWKFDHVQRRLSSGGVSSTSYDLEADAAYINTKYFYHTVVSYRPKVNRLIFHYQRFLKSAKQFRWAVTTKGEVIQRGERK